MMKKEIKNYKICKDCGNKFDYVRQKVRCAGCQEKRHNKLRVARQHKQLGGIPMCIKNGKIQQKPNYHRCVTRDVEYIKENYPEEIIYPDEDSDGDWIRIQLYNHTNDIVEYDSDKERRKIEYKKWMEDNL